MQISAKIMKELSFFCRLLFHLCRFDRKAIRLLPLRLLLVVANVWFCIAGDGGAFLFALFTCNRLVRVASCLVNSFSDWLVGWLVGCLFVCWLVVGSTNSVMVWVDSGGVQRIENKRRSLIEAVNK